MTIGIPQYTKTFESTIDDFVTCSSHSKLTFHIPWYIICGDDLVMTSISLVTPRPLKFLQHPNKSFTKDGQVMFSTRERTMNPNNITSFDTCSNLILHRRSIELMREPFFIKTTPSNFSNNKVRTISYCE